MTDTKKNINPDGNIMAHDIYGTNYPYFQVRKTAFNNVLFSIKRAIADYNPFAYPQIPSQKRIAFEIRSGNQFHVGDPYPNSVHWDKFFPTHYDPLSSATPDWAPIQIMRHAPQRATLALKFETAPRGCVRQIQAFKRCEMVNGGDKCQDEKNNILGICPNWALDGFKEKNRKLSKIEAIQTQQYRKVLEVSEYNKGRSNKDVSDKTWIHGTRQYLRPDTLWADERYANISQSEINEAKKRNSQREAKEIEQGLMDVHHIHPEHYDFKGAQPRTEKPLYP